MTAAGLAVGSATPARSWLALVTAECRGVSAEVLRQIHAPDLAELLDGVGLSSLGGESSTTRQALHARLQRMQSTITAGALILATQRDDLVDFILSRDFAQLRPLSAGSHFKARHLLHQLAVDVGGCERLFERCFSALVELASQLDRLDDDDARRIQGALCGMYLGPVLFGRAFAEQWERAFADAQRSRLLERGYLRLHFVVMGSYVGRWREHCEWLAEPANRELDLGDMYLFVRRDFAPEIGSLHVRQLRGLPVSATECLYSTRPWSTLGWLLDYIAACLREPGFLESAGLTLMLLGWLRDVRTHADALTAAREADRRSLQTRLLKIERIQVMEKRRFWDMVDGDLSPDLRRCLLSLWTPSAG